ncbi:porin [Reyranella sp.]|uniref:porin n=1 Tax=Reyranella sp. TaxID=1929291 RepID=UPI003BAACB20
MKKLLLGSTALVVGGMMAAPAMAADPIKIGVGGYYTFYALAGNIDSTYAYNGSFTGYKGFAFTQEGEIHFLGQTKLDNGTSVGLTVELEAWNPGSGAPNAQIDEAFLYAFGDWGRVELGSRDAASYRMYYGTPSALIGWGAFQHNHNWASNSVIGFNKGYARTMATTITPQWQDVNRINYFTPRFQGLQIGVGYAPKMNSTSNGGIAASGPGNPSGICGYNNATNINNCPTSDYTYQDLFDVGANYLNKFGNFTVALYGAFAYASFVPGFSPFTPSANMNTGANLTSWKQWVVGAQFGFSGFTVGGAVGYDNNGVGANYYTGNDDSTRFYTAGVMYETGPWQMSFMWAGFYNQNGNGNSNITAIATGTQAITTTACAGVPGRNSTCFNGNPATALAFGSNVVNKWEVGANYALGPGVKLTGGAMMYNASGPTNSTSGNSWAFLLGMDLRF